MVNAQVYTRKNRGIRMKSFGNTYIPFKFRFEMVSLMLHGQNNSFNGVFQKSCHKLLLRNMIICDTTCMASWNNFGTGSVPDSILLVWPYETTVDIDYG